MTKRRFAHALERGRERLHMGDLARHQELQRILGAGVIAEVDQPLIDDLGAGLGRDVAAQIDIELAGDLEVVGGPGVSHRVEQVDAAAAGDGDQRIGLGLVARELHRLEMHAGEAAYDLEVAQLLGADVHEQVFALRILAIEPLDRILHRRRELAVRAAELLEQHVAEARIGLVDSDRVHELLDVMIHGVSSDMSELISRRLPARQISNRSAARMFLLLTLRQHFFPRNSDEANSSVTASADVVQQNDSGSEASFERLRKGAEIGAI